VTIETERIRAEPHHEIGSIILSDAALLVERWAERARDEQPTAARAHHDILHNELLPFLQAVGAGLRQSGNRNPKEHRLEAVEHGEQRWDNGWSLTELVRDYQILQLVILEHLELELDRLLGYREAMAVGVFIDDAIAASIAAFVRSHEQNLKAIEQATTDAMREAQARKDNFLALVVHELRNPVAPIVNGIDTLNVLLLQADAPVRNAVHLIKRQSKHLARILDDLADLSRMEQGRLELQQAVIDVRDVIEQALQSCEAVIAERQHRVIRDIESDSLIVNGDSTRLVQVMVNLINNAARYTPPGGDMTIAAHRRDGSITITVRDTGAGIAPEMLSRVFDMYTRSEEATEAAPDGLGIGLALVRELVMLHGGEVEAFSGGIGEGAEFIVTLPAYSGSGLVERPTPEPVQLPSFRVLVVDDEPDGRESLSAVLRVMGHQVDSAADAVEGIAAAMKGDYQAAFVDIALPGHSGLEVAHAVRRERGSRMLLIGLAGGSDPEEAELARQAGFDAHLAKPIDSDAIAELLFRVRSPH
jgi:signal transduction histidine kinase